MSDTPAGCPRLTPEQRADLAEVINIERYLAMRAVWVPCWARRLPPRPPRPRQR